ncbi:hypothetical protein L917_16136, partial [Phytophthora nicotianae]
TLPSGEEKQLLRGITAHFDAVAGVRRHEETIPGREGGGTKVESVKYGPGSSPEPSPAMVPDQLAGFVG